jgi:HD superfamily phosphohydrolase YqeK
MSDALPAWAIVTAKRREHIERVTALLERWATALALDADERALWRDAGMLHDALRDAPESELRRLSGDRVRPPDLLHGPAAAARLLEDGETRSALVDAVRTHTVGSVTWARVGRALYMADYLEPGRKFSPVDRAYLAANVPTDFDGTFRQVVRARVEWSVRDGKPLFPETVALWNSLL